MGRTIKCTVCRKEFELFCEKESCNTVCPYCGTHLCFPNRMLKV